ncbi:hypothetical protein Q6A51_25105 [Pseudomonas sp. KFB-139]|uniref:Uncharacterized protein n=1 Tax=Pseudomonas serbiensis TaxID=3064350 RepID=A0ABT9CZ06_9PSED|nr:hypothetical protein [Pseudomonas sp. KFB-138]MDO7930062.1 hypothetical protein [Pseudomonas sp. KFB-138]
MLLNEKPARLVMTHTLTAVNDAVVKTVPVAEKKAFFIGGAADQDAYYFQRPFCPNRSQPKNSSYKNLLSKYVRHTKIIST